MTNKYKLKLLISSIVILLPSIAAIILNDMVEHKVAGAWHFGWILPIILVGMQIILHLVTFRENERVGQNEKIVNITFWMIPLISVYVSALFMMLSLGLENALGVILSVMFGIIFIVFGNFMPKARQNRVFGLKIKWTLANEENWAATHRFTGKIWVVAGVVTLLGAFLPEMASIILLLVISVPAVVVPIVYSYLFYKKQLSDGTVTKDDYVIKKTPTDKKSTTSAIIIAAAVLVLVVILMFVGSITFTLGDSALDIKTTYGSAVSIEYDDIKSIEYVPDNVSGMRVSGFASTKLLFGWFRNDELGNYTRYTYTNSEATLIIHTDDGIYVIADDGAEATKAMYRFISDKIMDNGEE